MSSAAKKIAVFASGSGSNAENLVRYFRNSPAAKVEQVFTNNPSAGVIERAKRLSVECTVFNRNDFYETDRIIQLLLEKKTDWIILAGFLWLIPPVLIRMFEKRIINIHPALLPAFGGKGFYGRKVHQSVLDSSHLISGITIHYVDEKFDEGEIIFQAACHIARQDSVEDIERKIHGLEHRYFPVVAEKLLR